MKISVVVYPLPFLYRHTRTLQTQSKMDESAMANLLGEKQLFLEKALKNYILCLRTGVWKPVHGTRSPPTYWHRGMETCPWRTATPYLLAQGYGNLSMAHGHPLPWKPVHGARPPPTYWHRGMETCPWHTATPYLLAQGYGNLSMVHGHPTYWHRGMETCPWRTVTPYLLAQGYGNLSMAHGHPLPTGTGVWKPVHGARPPPTYWHRGMETCPWHTVTPYLLAQGYGTCPWRTATPYLLAQGYGNLSMAHGHPLPTGTGVWKPVHGTRPPPTYWHLLASPACNQSFKLIFTCLIGDFMCNFVCKIHDGNCIELF